MKLHFSFTQKLSNLFSINLAVSYTLLFAFLIFASSCKKRKTKDEITDPEKQHTNKIVDFISVWDVTNNKIALPLVEEGGSYDFTVDWGDGSKDDIKKWNDPKVTHTYATNKKYTVTITGKIQGWGFGFYPPKNLYALNFVEVKNWGTLILGESPKKSGAFSGCENLKFTATDAPDLSKTTSLNDAFRNAINFNSDMNNWDVSNVIEMDQMFANASAFNGNISSWNTSKVESMNSMFGKASSFNQNIGKWNVSGVQNMEFMFYQASSFNQDISKWDVSKIIFADVKDNFSVESPLTEANKPKFK